MTARAALVVALTPIGSLAACNPRLFDRLERDVASAADDGGNVTPDAGAATPDVDAGSAGGAGSDGGGLGSPRDAGALDAGPQSDASAEPTCPPQHADSHVFRVRSTAELGALPLPQGVQNASLGASLELDDRLIWVLPDAVVENTSDAPTRTIAAYVDRDDLLSPQYLTDDGGAPLAFLPRAGDELTNNWLGVVPATLVPVSAQHGLLFYMKSAIFDPISVGLADVAPEGAAQRHPTALFEQPGPFFFWGGFTHEGYVYVFSSEGGVARAPLDGAGQPANYRAWSGAESGWVSDLSQQTPVITRADNRASVAFNRYLGRFLYVHSRSDADGIELEYADVPQGPYTRFASVDTLPSAAPAVHTQAGREHLGLRSECDRQLVLSYYVPLETVDSQLGPLSVRGEIRLLKVELE